MVTFYASKNNNVIIYTLSHFVKVEFHYFLDKFGEKTAAKLFNILNSSITIFLPARFRFSSAPTLTVGIELIPHHRLSWVEDASVPDGRVLKFTGYADIIVKYFAQAMNFT